MRNYLFYSFLCSSESINRSQCTLILLSQSFLSSEYCNQEFALAYQSKKLIVVMMDVEEFDSYGNIIKMKETNDLDLSDHPLITVYLKQYTLWTFYETSIAQSTACLTCDLWAMSSILIICIVF